MHAANRIIDKEVIYMHTTWTTFGLHSFDWLINVYPPSLTKGRILRSHEDITAQVRFGLFGQVHEWHKEVYRTE